ncbi:MAG: hypothetical protein H7Y18_16005 [Clostridiaceae bacterium]|nr:hypothetical protein [Clostridiaceae bacterium]
MKWNEVQKQYPDKWVKLQILASHEIDNKEYIDDMSILHILNNEEEATDELVNCGDKEIVYHTTKEEIYSEIRNIFFSYRKGRN